MTGGMKCRVNWVNNNEWVNCSANIVKVELLVLLIQRDNLCAKLNIATLRHRGDIKCL